VKKFLFLSILAISILAFVGFINYQKVFAPNVLSDFDVKISKDADFELLKKDLTENNILKDINSFNTVSSWMKYGSNKIPTGLYKINTS